MILNVSIGKVTATLLDETKDKVLAEYTLGNATVFVNVDAAIAALMELFDKVDE